MEQTLAVAKLYDALAKLQHLFKRTPDYAADVRMQASLAKAKKRQLQMDLKRKNINTEEEYLRQSKQAQLNEIESTEECIVNRLKRDDKAPRK